MSENKIPQIPAPTGGVFGDLVIRMKLILRLMADRRVNPLIKLLPLLSGLYLLIPDIAPGPVDDLAVIWFATYLFVEMCPPEIVQEHIEKIEQIVPGEWHDTQPASDNSDQMIDGEIRDKEA